MRHALFSRCPEASIQCSTSAKLREGVDAVTPPFPRRERWGSTPQQETPTKISSATSVLYVDQSPFTTPALPLPGDRAWRLLCVLPAKALWYHLSFWASAGRSKSSERRHPFTMRNGVPLSFNFVMQSRSLWRLPETNKPIGSVYTILKSDSF